MHTPAVIWSLAMCTAMVMPADGHIGDRVFPVYELPTRDLPGLRGSLEDWESAVPEASLDHNDFMASTDSWEGPDPSNLAWRVFLAWHHKTQRIYVAVERLDDVFLDDPSFEFISFSIDGDHSGGQFRWLSDSTHELTEQEVRQNNAQAQDWGPGFKRDYGLGLVMFSGGLGGAWASFPPWSESYASVLGDEPHHYLLEFAITAWDELVWEGPEYSRRSQLDANRIIGLQMLISDADKPGVPEGQYSVYPGDYTWPRAYFSEYFVDGILLPCTTGDCSQGPETTVQSDSWGRIKASFR